eukprot:RCo006136
MAYSHFSGVVRPPLRFENFQECWRVKWAEYLSTYNTTLMFFLPVMSDFQTRFDRRAKVEEEPEKFLREDGKAALMQGTRNYLVYLGKQGYCVVVGTMILMGDGRKVISDQSLRRSLVYHWDMGPILQLHYVAKLFQKMGFKTLVRMCGKMPDTAHVEYFTELSRTSLGAAVVSIERWWLPTFADATLELLTSTYHWQRQHHNRRTFLVELAANVGDKVVRLLCQALCACLGASINPGWGAFWFDLLCALLYPGLLSAAVHLRVKRYLC